MVSVAAQPFVAPAIPWLAAIPLAQDIELGPGLDASTLRERLQGLCQQANVHAVVAFGSRARGDAEPDSDLDLAVICHEPSLSPELKTERSHAFRLLLGPLNCGVDLVVIGAHDAGRMAASRWHVMGDVAREGQVLYVAG
ncbi:nucleotidyltransferase domain-containing protein [Cyanobium sp. HWJ4-Hawea]|uniref:nucleotidyltransferase family protein n=1 Tax=unclassified Cyanobium TaxID=2627006 RepID=UPI0020CE7FD7|nr:MULTISPECIES: nucleotidyltransferase domain-containing protein [unclassified Cyanobium]MCP9775777.1 nucleotidyltransferase domain-containing protein [Cyanobium sp. WAJ14-Wanaka]MCP9808335.1 nucleotidyltransferase domain-containing protein [Cyanobium sp. HWJ4-Hawea]